MNDGDIITTYLFEQARDIVLKYPGPGKNSVLDILQRTGLARPSLTGACDFKDDNYLF